MASIGEDFISIEVPENRVTVDDAVATYLFNSQILTRPDGGMTIVVPEESRQNAAVWSYLNDMIQMGTPVMQFRFMTCVKVCVTVVVRLVYVYV